MSLILVGCETSSGVHSMGPDTYTLSTSSEIGGVPRAKQMALTEANEHCSAMGKKMLALETSQSMQPDYMGDPIGHYEVTFRCLNDGDPELARPNYEKSPDIVIENR